MSTYPGEDPQPEGTPGEPTGETGYWERQAAAAPAPPPAFSPQPPYPQPYGQPYYGQPGGPVPPPNPYGAFAPTRPNHDRAGLALGLGITGILGMFCLGVPLLAAPFAWAIGHRSLREIRGSNGQVGGESMAMTGMVLGIIGTILLVLAIVAVVVVAIVLVSTSSTTTGGTSV